MKVSRTWLQKFFTEPLPDIEELSDALTFHAFEIEEVVGDVLDVNVLPDRACYALSHRGIAYEIAAILGIPLAHDPLTASLPIFPETDELRVHVADDTLCTRYMGTLLKGVKVGPSPEWLKEALESLGQRSINNVVDATNFVMLHMGQPLHAFDAAKLTKSGEGYSITVRGASAGEKITTLTGEEYTLPAGALLITDTHASELPLGIAGIKGGKVTEVTETTTDIIIESANFDGTAVRKTAQALKLYTDASTRFQNRPSRELAAYGMRDVLALIQNIAGGEVVGTVDTHPAPEEPVSILLRTGAVNAYLGAAFSDTEIIDVFTKLNFGVTADPAGLMITPTFERRDIRITQDVIEEAGRILGYDRVPETQLGEAATPPAQDMFRGIERIKDFLTTRGWSEISTPSFATQGTRTIANPLDESRPYLRDSLARNMTDALTRGRTYLPKIQGPVPEFGLFEIGTVFGNDEERVSLVLGYMKVEGKQSEEALNDVIAELAQEYSVLGESSLSTGPVREFTLTYADLEAYGKEYTPERIHLEAFEAYSPYPFALRDIAVWTPEGTEQSEVALLIQKEAGELLSRIDLFDRFEKDGRISYAFRLVLESPERTLTDADIDPIMARITESLGAKDGYTVR